MLSWLRFNESEVFVRQLDKGDKYEIFQPVYALSLVNENFIHDSDTFYHHYAIVNSENNVYRLDGLEFVFVELAKFKGQSFSDKKMAVLWLRFMTEIKDGQEDIAKALKKGHAEGHANGVSTAFTAFGMMKKGCSDDQIAKATGLSHAEIIRLHKESGL